jgi:MarR family transcriptional regulator, lower aerobic nicotinate degradation pathway regulator
MVAVSTEPRADKIAPPDRLWRLTTWLLSNAAGSSSRLVIRQLGRAGVRRDHYAILAGLDEFGPVSQAVLGRRLGIDRSDVVAVLNDLERDGLAVRAPDATDRRRNATSITPAGSRALVALDALVNEAQDAALEPLSVKDRQQLDHLLRRLVVHHIAFDRSANEDERPGVSRAPRPPGNRHATRPGGASSTGARR